MQGLEQQLFFILLLFPVDYICVFGVNNLALLQNGKINAEGQWGKTAILGELD